MNLLGLALVAGCGASDGVAESADSGSNGDSRSGGSTDTTISPAEPPTSDSSAGAGADESTDEILFDLPDGWTSETKDIDSVRTYRLYPETNHAVEREIIADSSLDGLTAPFFALDAERSIPIIGPLGAGVRLDERISDLAYIILVLSEAPLVDNAPWGDDWTTADHLMAYSSWNYGGIEEDETTVQLEIADAPAIGFASKIEGVPNHQFIHVLLTPDKQLLRIEVYPTDSVYADDIAAVLTSLRKGNPGSAFSS